MPKRSYIRLNPPSTYISWDETSITVPVGGTVTVTHSGQYVALVNSYVDGYLNGLATADAQTYGSATFTGVSAGTVTIPYDAYVGSSVYTSNTLTITVTAPVDDTEFLNKRGLTHFWENIDDIKQDKLTAGDNISITSNTISADTGMVYLGKAMLTATASQLDFNVPTTYDNYKVLAKLTYASASNAWLDIRLLDSGGTAIHNYHQVQRVTGTAWGAAINYDVVYAINSTGGTGDQAINLDMTITKSGTSWITYQAELDVGAGTAFTTNRAYGRIATATSPSTLRLISNSAFAVGGWIKVWGWNN